MATYTLSPYFEQQFFDDNGNPLAGGKVSTFLSGTATPVFTFSDSTGTLNTNPVVLSASGRCRMYLDPLLAYKFTVTTSANVPVGLDMDPVSLNQGNAIANTFQANALGSATAPAYGWVADPNTGIYSPSADQVGITTGGVNRATISSSGLTLSGSLFDTFNGDFVLLPASALGTGAQAGHNVGIGRNSSGSSAAGTVGFETKNGVPNYVWADGSSTPGQFRISTAAPVENGTVSDTSGTVVGTQVSWHESKTDITPSAVTPNEALAAVLDASIYDFRFKGDGYQDADGDPAVFTGFVGYDRADWFLMNVGPQQNPALNEISIPGYFALAFKAMQAQIDAMRKEGDALRTEVALLSQRKS